MATSKEMTAGRALPLIFNFTCLYCLAIYCSRRIRGDQHVGGDCGGGVPYSGVYLCASAVVADKEDIDGNYFINLLD